MKESDTYTIEEAAAITGLSEVTLAIYARREKLSDARTAREKKLRFPLCFYRDEIENYEIQKHKRTYQFSNSEWMTRAEISKMTGVSYSRIGYLEKRGVITPIESEPESRGRKYYLRKDIEKALNDIK